MKECNTCGEWFENEGVECHCMCCWAENCPACNCEKCCEKENIRLKEKKKDATRT